MMVGWTLFLSSDLEAFVDSNFSEMSGGRPQGGKIVPFSFFFFLSFSFLVPWFLGSLVPWFLGYLVLPFSSPLSHSNITF
jgi:hypothetical protein